MAGARVSLPTTNCDPTSRKKLASAVRGSSAVR